jgi:hypothetical protein
MSRRKFEDIENPDLHIQGHLSIFIAAKGVDGTRKGKRRYGFSLTYAGNSSNV